MKATSLLLFAAATLAPAAAGQDASDLIRQGEAYHARGSFAEALKVYLRADAAEADEDVARWIDFRIADSRWRSAAGSKNPDSSQLDTALQELQVLAGAYGEDDRDDLWAEVQGSLGDWYWMRRDSNNWHSGWGHYNQALDWWAGSRDIERARERYLGLVRHLVHPTRWSERSHYSVLGNLAPEFLERAVSIARSDDELGWTNFFLGNAYRRHGGNEGQARAPQAYQRVLDLGRGGEWYDDALFQLGLFQEERGELIYQGDGSQRFEPDYLAAVKAYQRVLDEFKKGETRYYDDARSRIKRITTSEIGVSVDRFFVPGSEVQYRLRWRNAKEVRFALYPVNLTGAIDLDSNPGSYLQQLRLDGIRPTDTWTVSTGDAGDHVPGEKELVLRRKPATGAYVLVGSIAGQSSRALVLVSDAMLVAKEAGGRLLAWFTDLESGKPIAEARVFLWERYYNRGWKVRQAEGVTAADGTVTFEREGPTGSTEYYVAAASGGRQAFVLGSGYRSAPSEGNWRVYSFSDRPAYRPADEIRWKAIARIDRLDGYETPAETELSYRVIDPRNQTLAEGVVTTNAFGACWGELTTEPTSPLGAYRLELRTKGGVVSNAELFRLEEYKLPEFEVSVSLPDDPDRPGRPKLFRLGDRVEAEIAADYYFGGPVAGATVEVLVYQRPYYYQWQPQHEYPWFYADATSQRSWWGGPGQLMLRESHTTDALGRVQVAFDVPGGAANDLEYTIEARVVDASRRQVVSSDRLRVTRQAYFVKVEPAHRVHRPGDRVELNFEARDANRNPIPAEGDVVVTRYTWNEVWIDPRGRQLSGKPLERRRSKHGVFPPPDEPGWVLKFRGYESEEVARTKVQLAADGTATWSFPAEREGYYRVAWTSEDDRRKKIHAQASIWIADETSQDLAYRQGDLEILVDKDTLRTGEDAVVLLSTPRSDRYVLFTVEGKDLYEHRVVHVSGTVKLLTLELGREHVPNVYLGATLVSERNVWIDQEELIVPPVEQFLDVELSAAAAHAPGETGTVAVTVTDHEGKPVQGEVSLAVYDASLAYIQAEQSGDPRQHFYGERNQQAVRTTTTTQQRRFERLVKDKDGDVVDERFALKKSEARRSEASPFASDEMMVGLSYASDFEVVEEAAEAFNDVIGIGGGGPVGAPSPRAKFGGRQNLRASVAADQPAPDLGAVEVRTDFRKTAAWEAALVLDEAGRAEVEVRFPQSTTRWTALVRASDTGARFGYGSGETVTRQPLIARLQAPRFLQVGDEVTVSANLNNNTGATLPVHALLEADGVEILGRLQDGELMQPETGALAVAPAAQVRVDWVVRVTRPGSAALRLKAASPEHSDGMALTLPVYEYGIEAFVARAGKMTGDELRLTLDLPAARRAGTSTLAVQLTPSLAVTMLDALPYLVDYPYGCTEQTMSRFLPAVVVAGTLRELGLSPEDALGRVFGGIEPGRAGEPGPIDALDEVVAQGLARLYDFQHGDGGWSWWKTGDSDHWMSAYVVWGLTLAQEAGVEVRGDVLDRGRRFLELEIVERELDSDLQAWMLFGLAKRLARDEAQSEHATRAFDNLWEQRSGLNAYGRALLTMAARDLGRADEAAILAENLANGVIRDDAPDRSVVQVGGPAGRDDALRTAHWGEDGVWTRWSDGGVEATAFALRALLAADPTSELVAPAVNWLVQNRRGNQWSNTRDTAMVVLALTDYLKASGELESEVEYELSVNGTSVAQRSIAKDDLLAAPSVFDVDPSLLQDGANEIRVVRTKGGPLYFAANATFFSEEDPIPARGNQLFVRREYYRLKPVPTLLKGVVYEKEKLEDGASVPSGDRIEVVLTVEAKNHLEYLAFEDLKPAGFEAVQQRSGEWMVARELKANEVQRRFVDDGAREELLVPGSGRTAYGWRSEPGYTGRTRGLHQELRDRKVALFVDKLPQGVWEMRYELRAEVPGKFHALPVLGHAMYVPEVRCNSTGVRVDVLDQGVL
ncbi:MAG: MG2 domain-containing protein [Planctomycetota bacterium]